MPTSSVTVHFPCPVERMWQVVTELRAVNFIDALAAILTLQNTLIMVKGAEAGAQNSVSYTAVSPERRPCYAPLLAATGRFSYNGGERS